MFPISHLFCLQQEKKKIIAFSTSEISQFYTVLSPFHPQLLNVWTYISFAEGKKNLGLGSFTGIDLFLQHMSSFTFCASLQNLIAHAKLV